MFSFLCCCGARQKESNSNQQVVNENTQLIPPDPQYVVIRAPYLIHSSRSSELPRGRRHSTTPDMKGAWVPLCVRRRGTQFQGSSLFPVSDLNRQMVNVNSSQAMFESTDEVDVDSLYDAYPEQEDMHAEGTSERSTSRTGARNVGLSARIVNDEEHPPKVYFFL